MNWWSSSSLLGQDLSQLLSSLCTALPSCLHGQAFSGLMEFSMESGYIHFPCWVVFCCWSNLRWLTEDLLSKVVVEGEQQAQQGRTGTSLFGNSCEFGSPHLPKPCSTPKWGVLTLPLWDNQTRCVARDKLVLTFFIVFYCFYLFYFYLTLRKSLILPVCFLKGISQREI